ncbi:zinc ribbon domain-containing protein [Clostridium niameyense]|uniref:Zinc ribbon domain-containing protein n=1 Tax=Clostridium niameyense TaxID=1622073 RepID=A0A6M0RAK5_9CLOT|nr:zinc ribbon domain-containing protein [Clostridium niameyense]NEZ47295.1 zinc ribbon domain-containing protein [Clostridium niameyense]
MICAKCSNKIDDDSLFCNVCGSPIKKDGETKVVKDTNSNKKDIKDNSVINEQLKKSYIRLNKKDTKVNGGELGFFIFGLFIAIIGAGLFFAAGEELAAVGESMTTITSVSGDSIAEVYYQDVGKAVKGFAMFCRALGTSVLFMAVMSISKYFKR